MKREMERWRVSAGYSWLTRIWVTCDDLNRGTISRQDLSLWERDTATPQGESQGHAYAALCILPNRPPCLLGPLGGC